jgi:E3 ubiquitin-protein ligase SHPRH
MHVTGYSKFRLVPRLASFAVSGTPARTQISDLMHVLKYARSHKHNNGVLTVGTGSCVWIISLVTILAIGLDSQFPATPATSALSSRVLQFGALDASSWFYTPNATNRTTKASVTAELTIPQQTRYLVSIEMGPVERHVRSPFLDKLDTH